MAQKQPQVLKIDPPAEIKFIGPFHDVVTSNLMLTNPSNKRVCFKVKTTAPKRYCVRPNSGFLKPQASVAIAVMLQPVDSESSDKGKHKFMVQSLYTDDDVEDVEKLFASAKPNDLMDSKLRCVFEGEGSEEVHKVVAPTMQVSPEQQQELKSLMEECKRLQSDNATLKQQIDEAFLSRSTVHSPLKPDELPEKLKQQALMAIAVAFLVGLILGLLIYFMVFGRRGDE